MSSSCQLNLVPINKSHREKIYKLIGSQPCQIDGTSLFNCDQIDSIINVYYQSIQYIACIIIASSQVTDTTGIKAIDFKDTSTGNEIGWSVNSDIPYKTLTNLNLTLSDDQINQIIIQCNKVINKIVDALQEASMYPPNRVSDIKTQDIFDTLYNLNSLSQKNDLQNVISTIKLTIVGDKIMLTMKNKTISDISHLAGSNLLINIISEQIVQDMITIGIAKLKSAIQMAETNIIPPEIPPKPVSKWVYIIGGLLLICLLIYFFRSDNQPVQTSPSETDVDKFLASIPKQYLKF
jgi:hypothetical protein